jgi:hypothetical protein
MSTHSSVAYFTICSANYLPTAKILLKSLRLNTPNDIYIIICDTKKSRIDEFLNGLDVKIIFAEDLDIIDFNDLIYRYSILELNTALKPFTFSKLFEKRYKKVFYFDPDIVVEKPLHDFEKILDNHNALVTPHLLSPFQDRMSPTLSDISNSGLYNLGFLGLSNKNTNLFLDWWMNKCKYHCYSDIDRGLFTDQRFCDYLPLFVANTKIYPGPEANIAYWNLHERQITYENNKFLANGIDVLFFHLSGIVYDKDYKFIKLSKHESRFGNKISKPLRLKIDFYLEEMLLNKHKFNKLNINEKYGFDEIDNIQLGIYSRTYVQELEIRDGPLYFSDIDSRWFDEPSIEYKDYKDIPRILVGIYQSRKDLQQAFNIKNKKGLYLFYDWVINEINLKNLPDSYLKLIPKDVNLKKPKKISKQNIYSLLLKLSKRYPFIASNKYLQKYKIFLISFLTGFKTSDNENEAINFGLFQKNIRKEVDNSGVNLFGYFDASTGVANGAKLMDKMLNHIDVNKSLYTIKIDDNSIVTSQDKEKIYHDISIFHINADQTPNCIPYIPPKLKNSYKIGFWAWELERFPTNDLKNAGSLLNDLWVPSKFIANAIERSCNFSPKIIPHPIETHLDGDFDICSKFNLDKNLFKITTTFDLDSYIARKNPFGSIEAYIIACNSNKEFKKSSMMIVKISGSSGKENVIKSIMAMKSKHKLNIVIIDSYLTTEEMHGLRNISDVFISLHRSEGFGLNIIENMNAGNVVIATNYSGNTDFMDDTNSLVVDYKLIPLKENEYPAWKGQFWAEPSLDEASEKLIWAYLNQDNSNKIVEKAKAHISSKFSIGSISKLVKDELVKI